MSRQNAGQGLFRGISTEVAEEIKAKMILAAGFSPAGVLLPALDTTAIAALWGRMLYNIAKIHNVSMSRETCVKVAASCLIGVSAYLVGSKVLTWLLNFIPGLQLWPAMAGNALFNAYYTYDVGRAFDKILSHIGYADLMKMGAVKIAKKLSGEFLGKPGVKILREVFGVIKPKNA